MRLPRFTKRRLMVLVAVAAVVLAMERILFYVATEFVRAGDPGYRMGEAVTAWIFLNIGLSVLVGVVAAMAYPMRLRRFRTRTLTIAVAIVAICLTLKFVADRWWVINGERKSLAMDHLALAEDYDHQAQLAKNPSERAQALELAKYHSRIYENLMSVVERPWLPVPPDPPPPE